MNGAPSTPEAPGLADQDRLAVKTLYRAGMKPLIKRFAAAFSDLDVNIHEIIAAPGRAAIRAEITGTHTGEWFGIAPTNTSFVLPIHEFHHLEKGRLTHTWHLEDWRGWFHQVGAFPPQENAS